MFFRMKMDNNLIYEVYSIVQNIQLGPEEGTESINLLHAKNIF